MKVEPLSARRKLNNKWVCDIEKFKFCDVRFIKYIIIVIALHQIF